MNDDLIARCAAWARECGALRSGEATLALVSGGADSLFLMHMLATAHDGPVGVLTIDHGFRPEAAAETAQVVAAATTLGLPVRVERLGLVPGPGAPQRARRARYASARRIAAEDGWSSIATGHTASDQAETVLMRIARGTGRDGARAMASRDGDLVRPMLAITADEVRKWCGQSGLVPVMDPSNDDDTYTRTRARRLVADLARVSPGADRNIAAFADRMRDESTVLAGVVDAAWARCRRGDGLDVAGVVAEPVALSRLLIRRLLDEAGAIGEARSSAAVERILDVARGRLATQLAGGLVASRAGGTLTVSRPAGITEATSLNLPGEVAFGPVRIGARMAAAQPCDADRVFITAPRRLVVRGWRPGDRIAMADGHHQSVARMLASRGVPSVLRPEVPIVVADSEVAWVVGHRVSAARRAPLGQPAVQLEVVR